MQKRFDYIMATFFGTFLTVLIFLAGYGGYAVFKSFDTLQNPNGNMIFKFGEGTDVWIGLALIVISLTILYLIFRKRNNETEFE